MHLSSLEKHQPHTGFSEALPVILPLGWLEKRPRPSATASGVTGIPEPSWPLGFSSLGFKNSRIFQTWELDGDVRSDIWLREVVLTQIHRDRH